MNSNEVKAFFSKIKRRIQNSNIDIELLTCLAFFWTLLMGIFLFTEVGRMILSAVAYVSFVFTITMIFCWLYYGLRDRKNMLEKDDDYTEDVPHQPSQTCVIISEEVSNNSEIDKPIYYILDTSAFFAIQEYTTKRNRCVSDLLYGDMTLNDNFKILYEAIRTRRCYVTEEIVEEIAKLEERGLLETGILEFIEEDISVWRAPNEMPEVQKLLSKQDIDENKHYKVKHYKLVWNAAELAESVDGEVYIVTSCKKMTSLADANQVKVIEPLDFEKED